MAGQHRAYHTYRGFGTLCRRLSCVRLGMQIIACLVCNGRRATIPLCCSSPVPKHVFLSSQFSVPQAARFGRSPRRDRAGCGIPWQIGSGRLFYLIKMRLDTITSGGGDAELRIDSTKKRRRQGSLIASWVVATIPMYCATQNLTVLTIVSSLSRSQ